jgi:dihydrofolate synthase/folylpolyglutamate synthase
MLNTKDIGGYLAPLAAQALSLTAVSIPGEAATLPAEATAQAARAVALEAQTAESAVAAVRQIAAHSPRARILICGSLYLAGGILRENG